MPKATVVITADNQLKKGIDPAKKTMLEFEAVVSGIEKKLSKALTITGLATAAVASFKAVENAAKDCINAFSEVDKVTQRLNAVWKNVGETTGKTASEMNDLASALEKQTYFAAENIKEAGLLLAATESLTDEGFERALNASLDLAAALGEDVTSAAQTLAKAVQEPENALSRLKSIEVSFTEDEKKQIKALADANQEYEAQSLILDKIEQKYKDVAKAINNTPTGLLDNMDDTLEDIRKNLGSTLLDTITPALRTLYGWLEKISQWTADQAGLTAVITRAQSNGDLSGYSVELLQKARDEAWNRAFTPTSIAEDELNVAMGRSPWEDVVDYIDKAIASRAEQTIPETVADIIEGASTAVGSGFSSFLEKYASSDTWKEQGYQSIIDTANAFINQIESWKPELLEGFVGDELLQALGLDAGTDSSTVLSYLGELKNIVADYEGKIEAFYQEMETVIPEILDNPVLTDLDDILDKYGKNSVSYQKEKLKEEYNRIAAVYEYASEEQKVYLKEILEENEAQRAALEEIPDIIEGSFLDKFSSNLSDMFERAGLGNNTQASAAAGGIISSFTSSMGEAGEVVSTLAQNMMTMGPALGAIVTALKYVFEGLSETLGPVLNEFVEYGIEPLREFGRVLGDVLKPLMEMVMPLVEESAESLMQTFHALGTALMPIVNLIVNVVTPIFDSLANTLKFIEPIVEAIAYVLATVNGVLSYVGQAIMHGVAIIMNWLASINLMGWRPFEGLRMTDPGTPGSFTDYMGNIYSDLEEGFNKTYMSSASNETALSSASYRGATNVTINIYASGPFVGDNGMRQFAEMIREEFDALDYYGVGA